MSSHNGLSSDQARDVPRRKLSEEFNYHQTEAQSEYNFGLSPDHQGVLGGGGKEFSSSHGLWTGSTSGHTNYSSLPSHADLVQYGNKVISTPTNLPGFTPSSTYCCGCRQWGAVYNITYTLV